jgi:hypothetical protein
MCAFGQRAHSHCFDGPASQSCPVTLRLWGAVAADAGQDTTGGRAAERRFREDATGGEFRAKAADGNRADRGPAFRCGLWKQFQEHHEHYDRHERLCACNHTQYSDDNKGSQCACVNNRCGRDGNRAWSGNGTR